MSFETAMISGALITMGSLYSYHTMVLARAGEMRGENYKDSIDVMDDPYDLYDEERANETEDIKEMIQKEKARQKQPIIKNTVENGSAWVSAYRLIPYVFLILGFFGLQTNHIMHLFSYMVGLAFGIMLGYFMAKEWFFGDIIIQRGTGADKDE